jgi:hypothetical protein
VLPPHSQLQTTGLLIPQLPDTSLQYPLDLCKSHSSFTTCEALLRWHCLTLASGLLNANSKMPFLPLFIPSSSFSFFCQSHSSPWIWLVLLFFHVGIFLSSSILPIFQLYPIWKGINTVSFSEIITSPVHTTLLELWNDGPHMHSDLKFVFMCIFTKGAIDCQPDRLSS